MIEPAYRRTLARGFVDRGTAMISAAAQCSALCTRAHALPEPALGLVGLESPLARSEAYGRQARQHKRECARLRHDCAWP